MMVNWGVVAKRVGTGPQDTTKGLTKPALPRAQPLGYVMLMSKKSGASGSEQGYTGLWIAFAALNKMLGGGGKGT